MYYLKMFPHQVRSAIEKNLPVILPIGVIEYHAEHLTLGVDTHVVEQLLLRLEQKHPDGLVVLPTFTYGTASYAVAAPEQRGTLSVDSRKVRAVAEDIFRGLLRVGFRNIHAFIAHQTEEFEQGMPTDLAFRFAGRRAIFEFLEKTSGEGWWGNEEFSQYYSGGNNPFAWIRVHPVRTSEAVKERFEGDHAGKLETSEMMALCPENVDMARHSDACWFARPALEASKTYGEEAAAATLADMEKTIFG